MVKRIFFLLSFFIFLFGALVIRLFYWQIIKGQSLAEIARGQYEGGMSMKGERGDILASDGSWFVASTNAWLVYASIPKLELSSDEVSEKIAPILVEDAEENVEERILEESLRISKLLKRPNAVWVPIKQKISTETKDKIEELEIDGIGFQAQEDRVYPEASNAAHLLGFVGRDENGEDKGYFGLEGHYDMVLSGKSGYLSRQEDLRGVPILLGQNNKESLATKGVSLQTNINKTIQISLESKLRAGIEKYGAVSGSGIVMDPKTGAILAMSSFPSYDQRQYEDFKNELFLNPVISSTFEPGSIFKVLVMASALDSGVVKPETQCTVCDSPYKVGKYLIKTWNDKYHADATMTEVIVNSDNVGMSFVGSKLGADKLYDYLDKFGIGRVTGIDLQGEATARLRDKGTWGDIDLATTTFGQGIAVTNMQMIRAVAAIANKGIVMKPQVVGKIINESWEDNLEPIEEGRVISEKAAKEITTMMVEAARNGESKWTNTPGFKVAGKTGTAQIPIQGHYDEEKTIASFIGFSPYDNPKFIMLITLQEPQSSPWASETAAPLWYSIAKDLFMEFNIQPEN